MNQYQLMESELHDESLILFAKLESLISVIPSGKIIADGLTSR